MSLVLTIIDRWLHYHLLTMKGDLYGWKRRGWRDAAPTQWKSIVHAAIAMLPGVFFGLLAVCIDMRQLPLPMALALAASFSCISILVAAAWLIVMYITVVQLGKQRVYLLTLVVNLVGAAWYVTKMVQMMNES